MRIPYHRFAKSHRKPVSLFERSTREETHRSWSNCYKYHYSTRKRQNNKIRWIRKERRHSFTEESTFDFIILPDLEFSTTYQGLVAAKKVITKPKQNLESKAIHSRSRYTKNRFNGKCKENISSCLEIIKNKSAINDFLTLRNTDLNSSHFHGAKTKAVNNRILLSNLVYFKDEIFEKVSLNNIRDFKTSEIKEFFVSYTMNEPENAATELEVDQSQSKTNTLDKHTETKNTSESVDENDDFYQTALDFAKKNGFGFVEFLEICQEPEEKQKTRKPRKYFSKSRHYRETTHAPRQEFKKYPVMGKISSEKFEKSRNTCKDKEKIAVNNILTNYDFMEATKESIEEIKKLTQELSDLTNSDGAFSRTKENSGCSKTKEEEVQTFTPNEAASSGDAQIHESPKKLNEEDIIRFAPMNEYAKYLTQVCEDIYQNKRSPSQKDELGQPEGSQEFKLDLKKDQNSDAIPNALNLTESSSKEHRKNRNSSILKAKKPFLRKKTEKTENRNLNHESVENETTLVSESKGSLPLHENQKAEDTDLQNVRQQNETFLMKKSTEKQNTYLPGISSKTNSQYRICNSVSSTIFRELQNLHQATKFDKSNHPRLKTEPMEVVHIHSWDFNSESEEESDEFETADEEKSDFCSGEIKPTKECTASPSRSEPSAPRDVRLRCLKTHAPKNDRMKTYISKSNFNIKAFQWNEKPKSLFLKKETKTNIHKHGLDFDQLSRRSETSLRDAEGLNAVCESMKNNCAVCEKHENRDVCGFNGNNMQSLQSHFDENEDVEAYFSCEEFNSLEEKPELNRNQLMCENIGNRIAKEEAMFNNENNNALPSVKSLINEKKRRMSKDTNNESEDLRPDKCESTLRLPVLIDNEMSSTNNQNKEDIYTSGMHDGIKLNVNTRKVQEASRHLVTSTQKRVEIDMSSIFGSQNIDGNTEGKGSHRKWPVRLSPVTHIVGEKQRKYRKYTPKRKGHMTKTKSNLKSNEFSNKLKNKDDALIHQSERKNNGNENSPNSCKLTPNVTIDSCTCPADVLNFLDEKVDFESSDLESQKIETQYQERRPSLKRKELKRPVSFWVNLTEESNENEAFANTPKQVSEKSETILLKDKTSEQQELQIFDLEDRYASDFEDLDEMDTVENVNNNSQSFESHRIFNVHRSRKSEIEFSRRNRIKNNMLSYKTNLSECKLINSPENASYESSSFSKDFDSIESLSYDLRHEHTNYHNVFFHPCFSQNSIHLLNFNQSNSSDIELAQNDDMKKENIREPARTDEPNAHVKEKTENRSEISSKCRPSLNHFQTETEINIDLKASNHESNTTPTTENYWITNFLPKPSGIFKTLSNIGGESIEKVQGIDRINFTPNGNSLQNETKKKGRSEESPMQTDNPQSTSSFNVWINDLRRDLVNICKSLGNHISNSQTEVFSTLGTINSRLEGLENFLGKKLSQKPKLNSQTPTFVSDKNTQCDGFDTIKLDSDKNKPFSSMKFGVSETKSGFTISDTSPNRSKPSSATCTFWSPSYVSKNAPAGSSRKTRRGILKSSRYSPYKTKKSKVALQSKNDHDSPKAGKYLDQNGPDTEKSISCQSVAEKTEPKCSNSNEVHSRRCRRRQACSGETCLQCLFRETEHLNNTVDRSSPQIQTSDKSIYESRDSSVDYATKNKIENQQKSTNETKHEGNDENRSINVYKNISNKTSKQEDTRSRCFRSSNDPQRLYRNGTVRKCKTFSRSPNPMKKITRNHIARKVIPKRKKLYKSHSAIWNEILRKNKVPKRKAKARKKPMNHSGNTKLKKRNKHLRKRTSKRCTKYARKNKNRNKSDACEICGAPPSNKFALTSRGRRHFYGKLLDFWKENTGCVNVPSSINPYFDFVDSEYEYDCRSIYKENPCSCVFTMPECESHNQTKPNLTKSNKCWNQNCHVSRLESYNHDESFCHFNRDLCHRNFLHNLFAQTNLTSNQNSVTRQSKFKNKCLTCKAIQAKIRPSRKFVINSQLENNSLSACGYSNTRKMSEIQLTLETQANTNKKFKKLYAQKSYIDGFGILHRQKRHKVIESESIESPMSKNTNLPLCNRNYTNITEHFKNVHLESNDSLKANGKNIIADNQIARSNTHLDFDKEHKDSFQFYNIQTAPSKAEVKIETVDREEPEHKSDQISFVLSNEETNKLEEKKFENEPKIPNTVKNFDKNESEIRSSSKQEIESVSRGDETENMEAKITIPKICMLWRHSKPDDRNNL